MATLKRRYNCKFTIVEEQYFIKLYTDGVSSNDIATECGMTGAGIRKILKAYNIPIRTNSEAHIGRFFTPINIKFWNKIKKQKNGCWEWQGYKDCGYGRLWYKGKQIGAHQLSWILHNGEIINKLLVLHKCDNPCCVNPDHLFLGTQQDNMTDMLNKGRQKNGPNSPKIKGK